MRSEMIKELSTLIVQSVNLHHVNPNTLDESTTLAAGGLDLDSIDILEIVVAVEQRYGVKPRTAVEGRTVFQTIGSMADFIESQLQSHAQA